MNRQHSTMQATYNTFRYNPDNKEFPPYDSYDTVPPITYAKGTIRRLILTDGRQVTEDPMGFGFVITDFG